MFNLQMNTEMSENEQILPNYDKSVYSNIVEIRKKIHLRCSNGFCIHLWYVLHRGYFVGKLC